MEDTLQHEASGVDEEGAVMWRNALVMAFIASAASAAAGFVVGRESERRQAQAHFDQQQYVAQAYIDSCEALTAAAGRTLEANRRHMLMSHGMVWVDAKGWVQQ